MVVDVGLKLFEISLRQRGEPLTRAHVRTQIRSRAIVLLTGLATAGPNVFESRPDDENWLDEELPGLSVSTPGDTIDPDETKETAEKEVRNLRLVVECRAKGSGANSVADQISAEVQAALCADEELGGLSKALYLASSETRVSGILEKKVAAIAMTFLVDYRIKGTDPETAIS